MRLRTLGGVCLDGTDFARPKPLLLLAYLALEGPKHRRALAELFWGGASDPMSSLRVALSQVRKGAPGALVEEGERVAAGVACDAAELLVELDAGEIVDPLARYPGPFLDGLHLPDTGVELEEWVFETREYLAGRVRDAVLRLAEHDVAAGRSGRAAKRAGVARRLAGAPPMDPEELERVHRVLAAAGSPLAREVRAEAAGLGLSFAPQAGAGTARSARRPIGWAGQGAALPPDFGTSFVGRDEELVTLGSLLRRHDVRLVTVTGEGGIGKTRLTARAAAEELGREPFGDGVAFVRLDGLGDAAAVPGACADAIGAERARGEDPASAIARHVGSRPFLLVLDGFEHLTGAGAFVASLLGSCERLTAVVTSRTRLGLPGEQLLALEGLPIGVADDGGDDAVRLFVQRAKRVRLDFSPGRDELAAVASICRAVGGSPLAIELAAPLIRALGLAEIAEEVVRDPDLLATGTPGTPERHRSVRAAFASSWALLREGERRTLARLSTFAGAFDRAAAATVAGATIPTLVALVDASLLRAHADGRFRQHPLLRALGRDELDRDPEEAHETRRRHAGSIADLVEAAESEMKGPGQAAALALLDRAHDDVRAALAWATGAGERALARRIAGALWQYWSVRGHLREARAAFDAVLALGTADAPTRELGRALSGAGVIAFAQGDYDEARRRHEGAVEVRRRLDDRWGVAASLYNLGGVHAVTGDLDGARPRFEESLATFRALGHEWSVAVALANLGMLHAACGDVPAATACYAESLEIRRRIGDRLGAAEALGRLGSLAHRQGAHDRALAFSREALEAVVELGERSALPERLESLARVHLALGDAARAVRLWSAADRRRVELGRPLPPDARPTRAEDESAACAALSAGAVADARGTGREMDDAEAVADALGEPRPAGAVPGTRGRGASGGRS